MTFARWHGLYQENSMSAVYTPPLFALLWAAGVFMVGFPATMIANAGISIRTFLLIAVFGVIAWELRGLEALLPVLVRWAVWLGIIVMMCAGVLDGMRGAREEEERA
ncbi:hypothetical protein [Paraburkholderia fungorum]|uniref:Uncharacterized protein n=2 Tax=Paraburkholderia fungorum TaxID=134537 RepID=A0AAW3V2G6_9BURK|nr:hypothetical protein [Paraburkholderia fungorum]MBB5545305.1 hypothetical protein [Paraburkholderia fungorum]MBB6205089.1 hypothetical protein [Paraburkholderia fungorum]MBU7440696.1 hypothetical protein [Paraburkholderia fungorum]PNE59396.1 hypothetical protein A8H39_03485 [Paraburkholderia fungorum]USU21707.1 hypothetical protein NFE55_40010 [Paraburkholderia fungorum]